MNNKQNEELWLDHITLGKWAYSANAIPQAAKLFHRAEETAACIGGADVRRGVAFSWLALCYFLNGNYSISQDMFCKAEHILSASMPSSLTKQIELNLALLGRMAGKSGTLPWAHAYYAHVPKDVLLMVNDIERRQQVCKDLARAKRAVAAMNTQERKETMRQLRCLEAGNNTPSAKQAAEAEAPGVKTLFANLWNSLKGSKPETSLLDTLQRQRQSSCTAG